MEDVVVVGIFDSKIIDNQGERNVTGDMFEEAIGDTSTDVPVFFQMLDEVVVSYLPSLF